MNEQPLPDSQNTKLKSRELNIEVCPCMWVLKQDRVGRVELNLEISKDQVNLKISAKQV